MSKALIVLVVEPMRTSGRRIQEALPQFDVLEARAPFDARQFAAERELLLAFVSTDYRRQAGHKLCRELSKTGVPVILLENMPTQETIVNAAYYGAIDLLICPPERKVIIERVRRALIKCGKILPKQDQTAKIQFPEDVKDARSRVEYVIDKAPKLLALPHAVSAVLRLCSRPDTGAADLAGPVKSDSALTASILLLVNSAAMGGRQEVTDVQAAIARLGMKATANLAMTQSLFKMFEKKGDTFGFDRTQYWIHSLGAACCARALAAAKRLGDPEDAFLAALLHDFGKMVLDEHLPSEYQQAVRIANVGREPVRRGEAATFEVDHTYVGERIADHWDLPDYLCRAIADHHKHALLLKKQQTDVSGKDDSAGIVRCVCLADQLAKAFGFGHAGDHIVERDALALWRGVNAVPGGFPAFYARVREELCKFLGLLQIPLGVRAEEPRVERVLLCFPEDEPEYRMLLEAFWARYGYPTVRQATLNDAPVEGPEMVTGVTHVSGSLEDVARAADTLGRLARTGMVIADGLEGNHEGKMVTGSVRAVGPALDFYVLNRWRRAVSAAHSPSPVNSDRGETALRPSDSSSEET